jgi:hypothetical protein
LALLFFSLPRTASADGLALDAETADSAGGNDDLHEGDATWTPLALGLGVNAPPPPAAAARPGLPEETEGEEDPDEAGKEESPMRIEI